MLIPTNVLCAAVTTATSNVTVPRIVAKDEMPIAYAIGTPNASNIIKTIKIIHNDCIAIYAASFSDFRISTIFNTV